MSYGTLLVAAVALPFSMLFACLSANGRMKITNWLWVAPVPALAAAIFGIWNYPVMLSGPPYHITFMLDASGCMLMLAASLLWIAAGVFVPAFFCGRTIGRSFPLCWLLTLIGSMGIFLAADLASFLVFYALVSLPAYGLVTYDGTPAARRAGAIYIGFALLGENLLLVGFVLLASNDSSGSLMITDLVAALRAAPWRDVILSLLIAAFGMKIALLPMHFWMPLSYTVLPIPAAAVLSGAAVKAGIIGLIRFLPFDTSLPGWGEMLTIVGLFGAFYGVILGITQSDPKTVLAYSSVSQMGFLAALLGMGLSVGDREAALIAGFYAAHHVLVKGALFLAVGVAAVIGPRSIGLVLFPGAAVALGLAGLPLTGGALAKLAAKVPFGYGFIGLLASCSAAGTALLMLHFLHRVASMPSQKAAKETRTPLVIAWLATALLSVGLPWAAYPMAGLQSLSDALAPELIWKTLWPVLVGVGLFIGLRRLLPRLAKHSQRRYCRACRARLASRSHLGSGHRKAGQCAEIVDARMPDASYDCHPLASGDGCRRLNTPRFWFLPARISQGLPHARNSSRPAFAHPRSSAKWFPMHHHLSSRILSTRLGVLLTVLAWIGGCSPDEKPAPIVPPVQTFVLGGPSEAPFRRFPGEVAAADTSNMSFDVPGRLVEFPATQGVVYKYGELLGRLDETNFVARVDSARADFSNAHNELARRGQLFQRGVISRSELDGFQRVNDVAEATLREAQRALDDTRLLAPFDGRVARTLVNNFQNVQAHQPVLVFQSSSILEVDIEVPEADMSAAERGITARNARDLLEAKAEFPTHTGPTV